MKSVLGDAVIRLLNPITISSTSVQLHWTVEKPSPLFHGFQVLYRLVGYGGGGGDDDDDGGGGGGGSPWMSEEVRGASERAAVLSGLRKGAAYRVKVRPFHGDTRGEASAGRTLRTPEEAPGAPPQEVRLHPFTEENSTGVLVAWQPPPEEQHNGVLTEYKVWCGGNDSRLPVIRSVDGGTLALTIPRLAGGVRYGLTVAAGNAAGVGPHSEPAYVLLDATSLSGPLERGDNVSLAEQISDVVRRPGVHRGHRHGVLGGAHGVQRVALPAAQEASGAARLVLRLHQQGSVFHIHAVRY
ncbi:roundabout homolog 1-like [Lampetra planeri]